MKRLLVITMVAGIMSFGAIAGQSVKQPKSTTPPAASSAPSETPAMPQNAKHVKKQKTKKHKGDTDTSTTAKPKN